MGENVAFLAKITFGTSSNKSEEQTFNLLVDTGSSWTWVNSCNKAYNPYWNENKCPSYYFDMTKSTSLKCSKETKYIKYGVGEIDGNICEDIMSVHQSRQIDQLSMKVPFLSKHDENDQGRPYFDGILGLSPDDESSGPLFLQYLYSNKKQLFSILGASKKEH